MHLADSRSAYLLFLFSTILSTSFSFHLHFFITCLMYSIRWTFKYHQYSSACPYDVMFIDCSAPFFADDNPMNPTLPQRKNSFIEFGGDLGIKLRVEQRGGYKQRSASRDEMDWHSKQSEEEDDDDDGLSFNDSGHHSVVNAGNHDYDLYEREREKERIRELAEKELKAVPDYPPKPAREEVDKNGMRRKNLRKVESVEELLGPNDLSSDVDFDLEDDLLSVSRGTSGRVSPLRNSLTPPRSITPLRKTPPRSLTPPALTSSLLPKAMGLSPALEFPSGSPESFSGANPLARQSHVSSEGSHSMRSSGSGLGSGSGTGVIAGLGVAALGLGVGAGLGAASGMEASNPMRASKPSNEEGRKVGGRNSPPVVATVFPLGSPSKAPPIALPAFNVSGDTAMSYAKSPVQGKSRPTSMTRSVTNVAPVFSSSRPGSMSSRPSSISQPGSVTSRPGTASSRPGSASNKQGSTTNRPNDMSRPTSVSCKQSAATATCRALPVSGPSSRPQSMSVMRPLSVSTLRPTPVSPSARPLSISSRTSSISNASRHFTSSASSRPVSVNLNISGPWMNSATPSYAPAKTAAFSPLTASTREKKEMMERLSMLSSSSKPVPYKSKSPKTSGLSTPGITPSISHSSDDMTLYSFIHFLMSHTLLILALN